MKNRVILLMLSIFILSCEKEVDQNCACNKITSRDITFIGVYESYSGHVYTTNECSGFTNSYYVEGQGHNAPNVGDCF